MVWILIELTLFGLALAGVAALVTLAFSIVIERRNPARGEIVKVAGESLHVHDLAPRNAGAERAFLLLHGANLDARDMRLALGDGLAAHGRVIIPDRPGQGYSPARDRSSLSPERQAALVLSLLKAKGVRRATVIGHSLGGLIALCCALQDPDAVEALVLINPTSHPRPGQLLWYQRAATALLGPFAAWTAIAPLSPALNAAFVRRLFSPESAPTDYARDGGLELGMTPRRFLASMREYIGLRDELARVAPHYREIAAPTLVVSGDADQIAPTALHAAKLAEAIPGAGLLVIPDAGHMAHHANAATIVAAIEALLARELGRQLQEG